MTTTPKAYRLGETTGAVAIACAVLIAGRNTLSAQSVYPMPYSISTLAGAPEIGGLDGIGSAARFYGPFGVAVDGSGNVYVADSGNDEIRKITPTGVVTTLAGTPEIQGSVDGTGSAARFADPTGVAVDGSGNVYVTDQGNSTIRKITAAGVVTTLAGTAGNPGSADGTGSAASFNNPSGVAVDSTGNVYVADTNNDTIRKITPSGAVTTLAGTAGNPGNADGTVGAASFDHPLGVAVDSSGFVYVADTGNGSIRKITPTGAVTTLAGIVGIQPEGVAVDSSGNVYVADSFSPFLNVTRANERILKIASAGGVTILAGGTYGSADATGSAASFGQPTGVAVDGSGDVYVADYINNTIRKITPAGVVTTLAGTAQNSGSADGTGSAASFNLPVGVAVDGSGNVYVVDSQNDEIRKITPAGVVTTLAGTAGNSGSADGTGSAARFTQPYGVAVDGSGNIYVGDTLNETIRKITPAGVVTTLAGTAQLAGSADGAGRAARFNGPQGVAVDGSGNLYVADSGNGTIREITPTGVVTTLAGSAGNHGSADGTGSAASFGQPTGVAVDGSGDVYVADYNGTIRKIAPTGEVTTQAGTAGSSGSADGTGSAARFSYPTGVAVDGSGNVYVVDNGNETIRRITPTGVVTTLAGTPGIHGSADGTGGAARFFHPFGVAVDGSGRIYIADSGNSTIRMGVSSALYISTEPMSQTVGAGSTVVFNCQAIGTAQPTFQWSFNGVPLTDGTFSSAVISGSAGPILVISGPSSANAGSYTCTVTNSEGTVTSLPATLIVNAYPADPGRLTNLSCRSNMGVGANVLIAGFVVGGNGTSGSEFLLARASGPALVPFGVTGVLPDPNLEIVSSVSNSVIASNNGWGGSALVSGMATAVGAFAWSDPSSRDSALVETLPAGAYTALVSGASGDSGIALAELYEVPEAVVQVFPYPTSPTRLINLSARTLVGQGGNALIAGFVIGGTTSMTVLIRASGPALAPFGLPGVLPDPYLRLSNSGGVLATNEGWAGNAQIAAVAASLGAFSWGFSATADSALLVTLPPGA